MFFNICVRIVHHSQGKLCIVTFELLSIVCLDNLTYFCTQLLNPINDSKRNNTGSLCIQTKKSIGKLPYMTVTNVSLVDRDELVRNLPIARH